MKTMRTSLSISEQRQVSTPSGTWLSGGAMRRWGLNSLGHAVELTAVTEGALESQKRHAQLGVRT